MAGQEPAIQWGGEVVWMAGSCPAMVRERGKLCAINLTASLPHCKIEPAPQMRRVEMTPTRIVLCADDYGYSPGVSRGIRELLDHERLSATSCMVVFSEFAEDGPLLNRRLELAPFVGESFNIASLPDPLDGLACCGGSRSPVNRAWVGFGERPDRGQCCH